MQVMKNSEPLNHVVFFVPGVPVPKGSLKVVPVTRKSGQPGVRIIPHAKLVEWHASVRLAASRIMAPNLPWEGPVFLRLVFRFPRPKVHFLYRRNGPPTLKGTAPEFVIRRPDLDKLVRSVLDAITGVLVRDDAQIVRIEAVKRYTGRSEKIGVLVVARAMNS
jgi:Holliday junction resolvase RusA-like endonuclease